MQEASLSGVFKIVLLFLLLYFVVKVMARLLFPIMGQSRAAGRGAERSAPRKDGEMRVEYTDAKKGGKRSSDEGVGEYIDYEEID